MREARVAPVLPCPLVDLLVLAEHHATGERRLRCRQAGHDGSLGTPAHGIEETREAAAPPAGGAGAVDEELARDPYVAKVGGEVEARAGRLPKPPEAAADGELGPHLDTGRQPRPARNPQQKPHAAKRPRRGLDRGGRPEDGRPRRARKDDAQLARGAVTNPPSGHIQSPQPCVPDCRTCQHEGSRKRSKRGNAASVQSRANRRRGCRHQSH
jgi:hypothetical protein